MSLMSELGINSLQADVVTYNSTIAVVGHVNDITRQELAWQVAVLVLGCAASCQVRRDLKTCSGCITACGVASLWRGAVSFASSIRLSGLQPDAIAATSEIVALERAAHWSQALVHLMDSTQKQWQPSVFAGNSILRAASRSKWKSAMRHHFLRSLQARHIAADLITYNCLVDMTSHWQEVMCMFQELHDQILRPDVVTLNSLSNACSNTSHWQQAFTILQELQGYGVKADVVSYNTSIAAYGRSRHLVGALQVLDDMAQEHVQPDVFTQSNSYF